MAATTILYVDLAGFQPLPSRDVLKTVGFGAEVKSVTDPAAAIKLIDALPSIDVILTNAPDLNILRTARGRRPQTKLILATDLPMERYSAALDGAEELYLDHVIANKPQSSWTVNEIRVTLQKIIRADIFGIDKYLASGTTIHAVDVTSSANRESYNNEVMQFAEQCRVSSHLGKMIWGISEELLMNAIYDAPAAAGIKKYQNLARTTQVDLAPSEYARLTYGCDGEVFAISSLDPFGLLTQSKLFEYVKKVLRRADASSIIDTKAGGAGLGLFKILYSSHALVCNVEQKKCSEIMALINLDDQLRDFSKMARSIHYFST